MRSLTAAAPAGRDATVWAYSLPARYDDRTSGPASTPAKPRPFGELLVLDELLGLDPALDRVVAQRRPQVLGDGDDVAAGVVQIAQRGAHLVGCLAHAEDEVGLGDQAVFAGRGEHGEAALVAERRAGSA